MSQDNYALLTRTGRLKEAQRMAGQSVPAITHMAFGDMDRAPTGGETALGHEVYRTALTGWGAYADQTAAFFDCYLPANVGGFVIREVGLIDAAGDLIAIARRSPGLPKTTPENGGGDDFTLRIDVFLEDLDTLVVTVSPLAGLTADNIGLFLFAANIPVEAVLSSAPASPIEKGQWIIAPNPSGIWAGKAGQIARWRTGSWVYETPRAGRMASYWTGTRQVVLRFDGTSWAEHLASDTAAGLLRLATSAEAAAQASTSVAVSPAAVKDLLRTRTLPVISTTETAPGTYVPTTTLTKISYQNNVLKNSLVTSSFSNSTLTIGEGEAGLWLIQGQVGIPFNGPYCSVQVRKNGSATIAIGAQAEGNPGDSANPSVSCFAQLAVGDYVELAIYHQGAAKNMLTGTQTSFSAVRLSA